ncbi:MAG: hypothetical protein ABII27_03090 [bacterium]
MKKVFKIILVLGLISSAAYIYSADVPNIINYQGLITNDGIPLNGEYTVEFIFFDSESDGTDLTGKITISNQPISDGVLSATINVSSAVFKNNTNVWLEVNVDGQIFPRQQIASVGYALRAQTAASVDAVDFTLDPGEKLYLDAGSDTYIHESAADQIQLTTGDSPALTVSSTKVELGPEADLSVDPERKLFLDGGDDTFIRESASDRIQLTVGNTPAATFAPTKVECAPNADFSVDPKKKIFLDGGGDTYINESAPNQVQFTVGDSSAVTVTPTQVQLGADVNLSVNSDKKLFLDGGGDTWIQERAGGNVIDFYATGSRMLALTGAGLRVYDSNIEMDSGSKLFLDGGDDTYILEKSENEFGIWTGGSEAMSCDLNDFDITGDLNIISGRKVYLDGGGDTYIGESSENLLNFTVGGNEILKMNQFSILALDGKTGNPAYSFKNDADTGFSWATIDGVINVVCNNTVPLQVSPTQLGCYTDIAQKAFVGAGLNIGSGTNWFNTVYASAFTQLSRKSLKKDIDYLYPTISADTFTDDDYDALPKMAKYRYKTDSSDAPLRLGYILQDDNETVFGNLPYVYKNVDSINEVSQASLTAYMIEMIRHLNERVNDLEERLSKYEKAK